MLYTKDDKRYVDMCIIFDREFPVEPRDDSKLYKYMYLVYYMLACKENYFKKFEDYNGYAQFAATTIYLRFLKKLKNGEVPKSLLNYAKKSMKFIKISYQNRAFGEVIGPDAKIDTSILEQDLKDAVQSDYSYSMRDDIGEALEQIISVVRNVIKSLVEKFDAVTYHRLYLSSLLTLLNSTKLSNKTKQELKRKRTKIINDNIILDAIEHERNLPPILYELSDDYRWIVQLIVNRTRQMLSNGINELQQAYALPDDVLDSIMASAYTEASTMSEKEEDYD